jgi:hypothetical protein
MATQGYDPLLKLAQIFWGTGTLTPEQIDLARISVMESTRVNDPLQNYREPELDQPPLGRFMKEQERVTGRHGLTLVEADLAHGLLICIQTGAYHDSHHPPPLGIYDHFKGGVYLITGYSRWASGNGEPVIEYLSMLFGTKHTRLLDQWIEVVKWPDGRYRSRFIYRGANLTVAEPSFKVPSPTHPPEG